MEAMTKRYLNGIKKKTRKKKECSKNVKRRTDLELKIKGKMQIRDEEE